MIKTFPEWLCESAGIAFRNVKAQCLDFCWTQENALAE
jgi:hypothetical protein